MNSLQYSSTEADPNIQNNFVPTSVYPIYPAVDMLTELSSASTAAENAADSAEDKQQNPGPQSDSDDIPGCKGAAAGEQGQEQVVAAARSEDAIDGDEAVPAGGQPAAAAAARGAILPTVAAWSGACGATRGARGSRVCCPAAPVAHRVCSPATPADLLPPIRCRIHVRSGAYLRGEVTRGGKLRAAACERREAAPGAPPNAE